MVTTDYDFQGLWLTSPFSRFFVAREETKAYMSAIGVPGRSGHGVRHPGPAGARASRSTRTRSGRGSGCDDDLPVRADLGRGRRRQLHEGDRPAGAAAASAVPGGDRLRPQRRAEDGRSSSWSADRRDQYRVLGYTTEMADLMRVATLFVGKPGGLSSSECMAAGLPMVLINPIPGQEERNSDFLLEEGAAVRCNYDERRSVTRSTRSSSEPARIEPMAASARRIGHPNAAATVAAAVATDDAPPVWITRAARESMVAASKHGMSVVDLATDLAAAHPLPPRLSVPLGRGDHQGRARLARHQR